MSLQYPFEHLGVELVVGQPPAHGSRSLVLDSIVPVLHFFREQHSVDKFILQVCLGNYHGIAGVFEP